MYWVLRKKMSVCSLCNMLSSAEVKINSFSEDSSCPWSVHTVSEEVCYTAGRGWGGTLEDDVVTVHWGFLSLKCYISLNFHDRFWQGWCRIERDTCLQLVRMT